MLRDLKLKPRLFKRWIKHCYPLGGLQNRRYFWRFQAGEGKREAGVERARGTRNRQAYKLVICTMTSFYYYDQNPSGFCCLVQIAAFVIYTSMGSPNLNMKGKAKRILVVVVK